MLTIEDKPTIHNAIWKRLHEPGKTEIVDIKIIDKAKEGPPHIEVGIWLMLMDRLGNEGLVDGRSFFDLPSEFSHSHLLNEIDQIAEQLKEIRRKTTIGAMIWRPGATQPREGVKGTGLRGLWPQ